MRGYAVSSPVFSTTDSSSTTQVRASSNHHGPQLLPYIHPHPSPSLLTTLDKFVHECKMRRPPPHSSRKQQSQKRQVRIGTDIDQVMPECALPGPRECEFILGTKLLISRLRGLVRPSQADANQRGSGRLVKREPKQENKYFSGFINIYIDDIQAYIYI